MYRNETVQTEKTELHLRPAKCECDVASAICNNFHRFWAYLSIYGYKRDTYEINTTFFSRETCKELETSVNVSICSDLIVLLFSTDTLYNNTVYAFVFCLYSWIK